GPAGNMSSEGGVDLGQPGLIDDRGDLPLPDSEGDFALIESAFRDIGRPFVALGGDHAITYPILRGLCAGREPVNVLHFDAHPDLYDVFEGNRLSHACPFARIMEDGLARRLVQVGIRASTTHQREQARRFGVDTVFMEAFSPAAVPIPDGPLYVTVDLDGLDPAVAPGVAHPEPGGLTVRDVMAVLKRIRGPLVGADVVELNPARDPLGLTAAVAAKLVKELGARMIA
ncbi:MAG TPA: arginase family protein, partial [Methylomirabilota bacterium]